MWLLHDMHSARKQGPVAMAQRQRARVSEMVAYRARQLTLFVTSGTGRWAGDAGGCRWSQDCIADSNLRLKAAPKSSVGVRASCCAACTGCPWPYDIAAYVKKRNRQTQRQEAKVYRESGIERYKKARRFPEATREAAGSDEIHRGIAAERLEELREFQATHPPKHTRVKKVRWDYIASGEGEEALLPLPGGAMVGEAGFTRIPAFEDHYRVIAPDYPHDVPTAAQLLDGLAGVLDAEGVRSAHVLGPSYGGLVAQCFVRRHPDRVQTLILANTGVPPQRLLRPAKLFLTLLPLVPLTWLRTFRERTLARLLRRAERARGGPGVLARLPARAHITPVEGGVARNVPARDRPGKAFPIHARRPRLLAGEGPDPGVEPGHRDAGAARRAEAMLPPGRGAHVPRCRAHALDEPQGGVSIRHQGVSR